MRRALGIAVGLVLVAAALTPPQAQASCVTEARKCRGGPLIDIEVAAKAVPHAPGSGRISYTLDYTMALTPSFAPYWGDFWVGGRFPRGARGPATATLLDVSGRRLALLTCREHADGVWCAAGSHLPHRGRVVFTARLASGGPATARLGFDSFEGLDRGQSERRRTRAQAREKFCNHRFTTTVAMTPDS
ncbi:hypothetical protein [Streptosporangium sp. NPDC023615]|uniref:hypothetical protein n=1 Tax=Streptosporangium sp. NPDC023615 TaxID=3154794 RepID=UPI003443BD40